MQSVTWDDDCVPPLIALRNGDTQFFDRPYWNCFQVGDQIIYMTEIGPSVYRVIDVQLEYDEHDEWDFKEFRRVTIRGV